MKIGIISDNHKKLKKAKKALDMLIDEGAEFIIHAGDIVEPQMLEMLKNSQKKYVAVFGNNDAHLQSYQRGYNLVSEPNYFKLADKKFKLMHIPYYMSNDAEIIVFGHTHMFEAQMKNNTLYLNPGEICGRKKPLSECAMLEILANNYTVTHYQRADGSDEFTKKEYRFEI